ncbi:MAG: hypothetical protein EXR07_16465 [Acetobacteraceae bacterium]|nr:hypothetical protein [Acetobacteraceae bacterium]
MSGAVMPGGVYPGLAQVIAGSARIKHRFDTLTAQASSGMISNTFSGLGVSAPVALTLGPRIAALRAAQTNIDAATGPARVTQTAITRIQSIASALFAQMPNLNGLSALQVDVVAATARTALTEVAGLLNSQYGGVYVFAGEDSTNPPVPDPDRIESSGFFTQISGAVANLSSNGAAATTAATLAIAGSNTAGTSPFSAFMSQSSAGLSPPSVSVGGGQSRAVGLLASANTSVPSSGISTTGSYMRDLMRALATIGSLNSGQVSDPNFAPLVSDTQTSVIDAITAMSTDVGILGTKQAALTATQTTLSDTEAVLSAQLSVAENVDMASTLSALTQTQTQLQASYQLISMANSMSLVKYLPSG